MKVPIIIAYVLLSGLTVIYSILVWYASGLWSVLQSPDSASQLPLFTLISIAPLPLPILWHMIHWQFLAFISLFICGYWGRQRAVQLDSDQGYVLPMLVHILWILFAVCSHMLGAAMPLLMVGHVMQ